MTGRLKSLEWKNNVLYLLDQRKLPQKQEYLACTDYKEAAQAIRTLAVRGAPAIGITAAYAMVLAALAFTARGLSGESLRHALSRQVRYWSRPDPRQSICPGLSGRWKRHLIPQRTINAVKP